MEQHHQGKERTTSTKTKTKNIPVFTNNNINGNTITTNNNNSPRKSMQFSKWVSDLNWRLLVILFSSLFLLLLYFSNYVGAGIIEFSLRKPPYTAAEEIRKSELTKSRIAVCLVGGARRFELTGPSIIERVLKEFPNSDLFLNSPLDSKSFKLSLLKYAPRVNSVRIFKPTPIPETESQVRVLTAANSPNGIQGLLQYFSLVEGCLTLIDDYQREKGFTYDWIVRTRVDGYWSAPLSSGSFIPGKYVVPPGSSFSGLNDRLGVGDYNTSVVALSRLSLIPTLDKLNYTQLNSETAFKAQLISHNVSYQTPAQPFCIVTDRKYPFPPGHFDVPVAALSSPGPLSGAKCRPCNPACTGSCVADVMVGLSKGWSWTPWTNTSIELCNAHSEWEVGWEEMFDEAAGKKLAQFRKRVKTVNVKQCVKDFKQLKKKAAKWDTPPLEQICKLGLGPKQ